MTVEAPRYEGLEPSSAKASRTARAIRRDHTKAEVTLRKALWALGMRYRKNVHDLPGKPDIVLPKAKLVVFVDGDFWHGRNWEAREAKLRRGANAAYWLAKIASNMARDRLRTAELETAGWTVVRVWETDVLRDARAIAEHIRLTISTRIQARQAGQEDRPPVGRSEPEILRESPDPRSH